MTRVLAIEELDRIDALRPPCPTCGGDWEATWNESDDSQFAQDGYPENCPDCVDGKVSIEQLVARWNYVEEAWTFDMTPEQRQVLSRIRVVKP